MTDLVGEASAALAPLLAAGGGAVAVKMAEDLGKDAAGAIEGLIGKLRTRLRSARPGRAEIEAALREGLRQGEISENDLRILVSSHMHATVNHNSGPSVNIGSVSGGTVHAGNTYNIGGDFYAK